MRSQKPMNSPEMLATPRLSRDDVFRFECGPHVRCFTECCARLELRLTPYDVLRLRQRLKISSADFLDRYTVMQLATENDLPQFIMKMGSTEGKRCPFVTKSGCTVYEDRPAACRIYPLGRASTSHPLDGSHREFYFTVREDHCRGFEQDREWRIGEWLDDQGMECYNRLNDLLMELHVLKSRRPGVRLGEQHIQMFTMACYNLERFRNFLFRSHFLEKFEVAESLVEQLRQDDVRLLEFGMEWLKFALFGEPVIRVRQETAEAGP